MKAINPLFNGKTQHKNPGISTSNVRKKPVTKQEGRKIRCDKKKDVKIPFSDSERILVKKLSKLRNMEPTPYCTYLLKKGLKGEYTFPTCSYEPKGKPYPAKLESHYHDLLFNYKVDWDCSLKESAYRIIRFMLNLERRALL
ncbi:hypothetical protein KM915_21085 [Cytobacillus oceanisediminis]|uniref:hypothetical protein n=1 Tax=Cytobacillus oceanisediminis TaxID=665099 RepID=UPI001C24E1A0|nr:hypothetical protein [Cytobacillus oceanisediminis]MBU8732547.1 hypothetical protein [Cytobacillus oceanisediminis]